MTVVPFVKNVAQQKPIDAAPKYFSEEQTKIWCDIVSAMKPGQFPVATHPLLEIYCLCISRARAIDKMLREINPETDFKRYRALTTMQVKESALLCSLSTRLRLLKPSSSRQDRHESAVKKPWDIKPWEDEDAPA